MPLIANPWRGEPRLAVVCNGVDPETGERCGRTYTRGGDDAARAAGWRIGQLPNGERDAMCPRCGKPDPALTKLCRDLTVPIGPGEPTSADIVAEKRAEDI